MSFIQFRRGDPLKLSSGESVAYRQLLKAGLNDHQARAVYLSAQEGLDHTTLQSWIDELNDPKRRVKRNEALSAVVRKVTQPPQMAAPPPTRSRGRKKTSKRYTLYSRSNHLEAKKRAKAAGLSPQPMSAQSVPAGISPEALQVEADEKTAGSLITTGYWTTA